MYTSYRGAQPPRPSKLHSHTLSHTPAPGLSNQHSHTLPASGRQPHATRAGHPPVTARRDAIPCTLYSARPRGAARKPGWCAAAPLVESHSMCAAAGRLSPDHRHTHTHTHTHTRPLRSKGEPNGRPRRWLLSPAYGQLPGSAPVAASNSSSSLSQSRLASVTMSTRRSTLNLSR